MDKALVRLQLLDQDSLAANRGRNSRGSAISLVSVPDTAQFGKNLGYRAQVRYVPGYNGPN
jgi:hypothetical protein